MPLRALSFLAPFFLLSASALAQGGWRMGEYNGQRNNHSTATGPAALPQFQLLIASRPAPFRLISPDGSLILFDGGSGYLGSFTSSGVQRWQTTVPAYTDIVGNATDIVIGPDGTIYTTWPTTVWAWNKDTGAPAWAAPVSIPNSGNEWNATITDSAGNLYINTGASYVGPPQALTSISPQGTINWQTTFQGRGYLGPVLSADETVVYINHFSCNPFGCFSALDGLATTSGSPLYGGSISIGKFAPWGTLYGQIPPPSTVQSAACTQDLSSCTVFGNGSEYMITFAGSNTPIASNAAGSIDAVSIQGIQLWTKTEPYGRVISDAAGAVFVIAPNTNDLVAFNGASGAELWRQHFDPSTPLSQVLLGDDGCLYASVGAGLYKGCLAARRPVILIHGYCSDTLKTFGNLESLLTPAGFEVHHFDYSSTDPSIEAIAYNFGQFVAGVAGGRHVDVIAHSEGGLVARAWMAGLTDSFSPNPWPYTGQIARLATIGTPHYGQYLSFDNSLLEHIVGADCSHAQANEMTYGSDFISRLHDGWKQFEQGPLNMPSAKMLFIAGTHNKSGNLLDRECYQNLGPVSSSSKSIPCNDGLVDVDSAVLPAASNVRYVPYQHCIGTLICNFLGLGATAEAYIDTPSHKTYVTLKGWLLNGAAAAQCCGTTTIDYTPSFPADEGLLLLRFRDANTKEAIPLPKQLSITFIPRLPSDSTLWPNVSSVTITRIPAPQTYVIVITSNDYESQLLQGTIGPANRTRPRISKT